MQVRLLLLEEQIKSYPTTSPRYGYEGEGAINPAYQVVEDSCLLRPNEKKIWALRSDLLLSVGIKNTSMGLHKGPIALKNAFEEKAHPYLNFNDRSGHPSLTVPEPGYDGSAYLAGWVCQRNNGNIEIALQSGRFQNKDLSQEPRAKRKFRVIHCSTFYEYIRVS